MQLISKALYGVTYVFLPKNVKNISLIFSVITLIRMSFILKIFSIQDIKYLSSPCGRIIWNSVEPTIGYWNFSCTELYGVLGTLYTESLAPCTSQRLLKFSNHYKTWFVWLCICKIMLLLNLVWFVPYPHEILCWMRINLSFLIDKWTFCVKIRNVLSTNIVLLPTNSR